MTTDELLIPTPKQSSRFVSLDVFRGIAIAGMILVNNPGSWDYVYSPLKHAEWHGCTPTDLIFPFFLFIVGVAMPFSFAKYTPENRPTAKVYRRIIRRCLILFALGLFLAGLSIILDTLFNNKPLDFSNIRIMGVLQRIGLCYLFASLIVLNFRPKVQWMIAVVTLIGYWIALQWVPVPGYGAGHLLPEGEGSLVAYIDRLILTPNHLLQRNPGFDPEGLFSTLPATVTVLIGYFTGAWLRQQKVQTQTTLQLVMAALSCLIIGLMWGFLFPINKQLWTSSFVIFTAGWALLLFAGCYELIEVRGQKRWGWPLEVMGLNAIFLFVASGIVARFLIKSHIGSGENAPTTYTWLYQTFFQSWAGNFNGSLAFALTTVLIWWAILYLLYRHQWFFKI
jgi:predicted acyltransferase